MEEEKWIADIRKKLSILVDKRIMTTEESDMYMNAVLRGAKNIDQRASKFGRSVANMAYDLQFMDDEYKTDIDDKLRTDLTQYGVVTKQTMYEGFAPQIYDAARKGTVIMFPDDINYSNNAVRNQVFKDGVVKATNDAEMREVMYERWKGAMMTFTPEKLAAKFSIDPEYKSTSIHYDKRFQKPSEKLDFIDWITGKRKAVMKDYLYDQNYAREINQTLWNEINVDQDVDYLRTADVAVGLPKDYKKREKVLNAFGVSKDSKAPYEELKTILEKRVKAGESNYKIMEDIKTRTGLSETDSGFKVYSNDTFEKGKQYVIKNFGRASSGESATGISEIDMR